MFLAYGRCYHRTIQQITWREQDLYGSSRIGSWKPELNLSTGGNIASTIWQSAGNKQYELTNHLGNVLATVSDKTNGTTADVLTMNDYYPFGMLQEGRNYSQNSTYRYGFNGKENDNDIGQGVGKQQDYGMRIYNPRLGRFFSVDPLSKSYPELTPYQFASNRPIDGVDLDGEEYYSIHVKLYGNNHRELLSIKTYRGTELGYGPKGPGIEYVYDYNRPKEAPFTVSRFIKNYHGIYVGPDNPTKDWVNPDKKIKFLPDYSLKPIDILDAAARKHDQAYDAVNAQGLSGALFNTNTLEADINLVQRANGVIDMYKNNEIDAYTNKPVSSSTFNYALKVKKLFTILATEKANLKLPAFPNDKDRKELNKVKIDLKKSKID